MHRVKCFRLYRTRAYPPSPTFLMSPYIQTCINYGMYVLIYRGEKGNFLPRYGPTPLMDPFAVVTALAVSTADRH